MKPAPVTQSLLRVWDEQPPPPQGIDHDVRGYGGTTTAFESLPMHVQPMKAPISVQERVVELNRENGRLQHEATYYENLANGVLGNLLCSLQYRINKLCSLITDCKRAVEGPPLAAELYQQAKFSRHAAERSNATQAKTKHEADFVHGRLAGSRAPLQPCGPHEGSASGALVVWLSRENGRLRQSIALNRKLAVQVLMSIMPQIEHFNLGLRSANDAADVMLKQVNDAWEQEISFVAQTYTDTEERGRSSTNSASCRYVAEHEPDLTPLPLCIPQWPERQDITENQTAMPFAELKRQRRILQLECSFYRKLIEEALVQLLPAIQFHTDEFQRLLEEYIAQDHKARCMS